MRTYIAIASSLLLWGGLTSTHAQIIPFYYANDFEHQKDFLVISDYYEVGRQINETTWPSKSNGVTAGEHYAWIYVTPRLCVFSVGFDLRGGNNKEKSFLYVLFSLEPIDVDAIRKGSKKLKDFQWTIGSGAVYFADRMKDITFLPADFCLNRPLAQAYSDLGNRSTDLNNNWKNFAAVAIHACLSDPTNTLLNGTFWGTKLVPMHYISVGLFQSFEGNDVVSPSVTFSDVNGNYAQFDVYMRLFDPDLLCGLPRKSFRNSGSYNGKPMAQYYFNKPPNPAPPDLFLSHKDVSFDLDMGDTVTYTIDSLTYNGFPFPSPPLSQDDNYPWHISNPFIVFYHTPLSSENKFSSLTLTARYPGATTLTASVKTDVGIASSLRTITVPTPPIRSVQTVDDTHTVTWGSSLVNYPRFTSRILSQSDNPPEVISISFESATISPTLYAKNIIEWIGPLYSQYNDFFQQDIFPSPDGDGEEGGQPTGPLIKEPRWTSSDPAVVSIDANGNFFAHRVGEVFISFSAQGFANDFSALPMDSFTISRKVFVPVPTITLTLLDAQQDTLRKQKLYPLLFPNSRFPKTFQPSPSIFITYEAGGGRHLTDEEYDLVSFLWISSNPAVASVSDDGLVRAITPGTTQITLSATLPPHLGSGTYTAAFSVYIPQLPVLAFIEGAKDGFAPLYLNQSYSLKAPNTVIYDDQEYPLFSARWTSSDENILKVSPAQNDPFVASIVAIGLGDATISFHADVVPYSGLAGNGHFNVTQRFVVSDLPILKITSRLADVYQTEADYIPLGANLTFPYEAQAFYMGEDYPLVNPTWTSSNPLVADVWQSPTGTRLFVGQAGEAILSFHAEGRKHGFNLPFAWHRKIIVIPPHVLPQEPEPTPIDPSDPEPPTPPVNPEPPSPIDPVDPEPPSPVDPEPVDPVNPKPIDPVNPEPAITVTWSDDGEDKLMKVGNKIKLNLCLIINGETFPYPLSAVDWLSSSSLVLKVDSGNVQALKSGYATLYAHVKVADRAWVLSRYFIVTKNTDLFDTRDALSHVIEQPTSWVYYSLTGKRLGTSLPESPGIYLRISPSQSQKIIIH
jgi:hypothetical protein